MEKVPLINFELKELNAEIESLALKKIIMAQRRVR